MSSERQDIQPHSVRREIALSWRRSSACGVPQEKKAELPYDPEFDDDSRLMRAAQPVVERLASSLSDTPTSILLADRQARIVRRWVGEKPLYNALDKADAAPGFGFSEEHAGTNGVGTTLEEAKPVAVRGEEHYADFLQHLSCVGVPIHHPVTRVVEGILDITCLAVDYNPLVPALLSESVRHIETRLSQLVSPSDIALVEAFRRACHRSRGAVIGLNPNMMLVSPAASGKLTQQDQAALWDVATRMSSSRRSEARVDLSGGHYRVRCQRVESGSHTSGIVLCLEPARPRHFDGPRLPAADSETRTNKPATPPNAAKRTAFAPVGRSPQHRHLAERIQALADVADPVAVTGEAGTGKFSLAKYLHQLSGHVRGLRVFNAGDPVGDAQHDLITRASGALGNGDTVILRQAEQLPTEAQARLRALAACNPYPTAGPIPGRLIVTARTSTASNDALDRLLAHFPHQLWVPPLCQHTEDIADLVPALLNELGAAPTTQCSLSAIQVLMRSRWPGNVAELRDALAAALTTSGGHDVHPQHIPTWVLKRTQHRRLSAMEEAERELIIETLASVDNNRTQAARVLGIGRATLYRRIRALGITSTTEKFLVGQANGADSSSG